MLEEKLQQGPANVTPDLGPVIAISVSVFGHTHPGDREILYVKEDLEMDFHEPGGGRGCPAPYWHDVPM